ncbi:LOW QUALITY PROTEIN: uncharacterized protein [Procambarus clarkii]|uniref:LOW QUALITY PROTEIN: uncharacterized protein n=1 Tax=Procambarus clarkii TaxID=6728 RepID=UPI00374347CF
MRAMTDLDTPGAVVWPKWCYSSKSAWYHSRNQTETETAQDLALNNNNTPLTKDKEHAAAAAAAAAYGAKGRRKLRREVPINGLRGAEDKMPSDSSSDVKSERLSPDPGSDAPAHAAHATPSPSVSPKSPASHRTRTPSFPGTPPNPAFTPPAAIPSAYDRFSPAPLGGVGGLPGGPGAIKQMESLMNRNCSDLMRSLAAKYNNSNPNDYFSSPNNGFLRHPLGGLAGFKHGSAPFLGVPTQPTTSTSIKDVDKKIDAVPVSTAAGISQLPHPGAPPMFPAAGIPGFPGFPLVDMSSSQVLLNMVRNASATQQSQLENYLRGAMKRPADAPTSPLDLSATMTTKRPRTEPSKSFDVKTLFGLQHEEEKKLETKAHTTRSPTPPKPRPTPSPGTHKPPTPCSDKNCPTLETIGHWTVDDVCSFVGSIELCAEYVEAFREQRIDGSALPLLTEEHLTSSINMKLGPALKLRSVLARRLGACNVCLHCDHCHTQTQERRPSSVASGQ